MLRIFLMILFVFLPDEVWAHRVNFFAYIDGGIARTEASFSQGRKIKDALVEVWDADNDVLLLRGHTDELGGFAFPLPSSLAGAEEGLNLRLRLLAGEGHQAEWLLKTGIRTAEQKALSNAAFTSSKEEISSREALEELIRRVVREQMEPLKNLLIEQRHAEPSWREIIGGMGWIIGLAGLFAYARRGK
ncbi:MAG: hypothetical protein FWF99_04885 [Desulfovibrionaceae bacterium]|nr:hypothetical protein [Desulfovibrionaceae bacterium]